MADDIIEKIDATLLAEANSKRFDPLGENWDNNETDPWTSGDAMRRRPASAGSDEGSEPAEAAAPRPAMAYSLSTMIASASLFEPGDRVSVTLPASSPVMYVVSSVDTIGAAEREPEVGAPADPVADAMRAEVLRQGLTECEIDGFRQEYRDGGWTVIDETRVFTLDNSSGTFDPTRPTVRMLAEGREVFRGRTEPDGPIHASGSFLPLGPRSIGESWARTAGPEAYWPEPVAPPVDAAVQPEMSECLNDSDIPTRPWWHRLFPGRSTR